MSILSRVVICAAAAPPSFASSAIFATSCSLSLQFFQSVAVRHHFLEEFIQLVVAIELSKKIVEPLAGFEQLAKRFDLFDDVCWIEIIKVGELQFDIELAAVVGQLVIHSENRSGTDGGENVVEVIPVDLDELPVLYLG